MIDENWRDDPLETTEPVRGSGDFLADRGYPDPVGTRIKFSLVTAIRDAAAARRLSQAEVVSVVNAFDRVVEISQSDMSQILRGNVDGYSKALLMTIVAALGADR